MGGRDGGVLGRREIGAGGVRGACAGRAWRGGAAWGGGVRGGGGGGAWGGGGGGGGRGGGGGGACAGPVLDVGGGVRGVCLGRAWGVRGACVGAISVGIARSALLSGYLGKSGHLPR